MPPQARVGALHVAPLGPTERKDALLGEHVERDGVNSLLVYDDEGASVFLRAHLLLEFDDGLNLVVSKLALGGDHLFPILGVFVVKSSRHL